MADVNYPADKIQVLSLMEAIRKRAHMYVGPLDEDCPNRVLQETLCKTISDGYDGKTESVKIDLYPDGRASIEDNGEGWPVDVREPYSKRAGREIRDPEVMLTMLFACREAKETDERKGLCNNGIVTTNALSREAKITIWRDGVSWEQEYRCGEPQAPLARTGTTLKHGTRFEFTLDERIVPYREFNADSIVNWALEMGGLRYDIYDHANDKHVVVPRTTCT